MISVPLPGWPMETRLPFKSGMDVMPEPSKATKCIIFEKIPPIARRGIGPVDLNLSTPFKAS